VLDFLTYEERYHVCVMLLKLRESEERIMLDGAFGAVDPG
jgi:hypothetical protein